jgi:hypothetical protein
VSDPHDINALDASESLDADKVDDTPGIAEEPFADYPPDRPQGVDDMAITPAEEAFPESVAERDARTVPDPLVEELDKRAEQRRREARTESRRQGTDAPPGNRIVGAAPHGDEEDLGIETAEVPGEGQWSDGEQVQRLVSTTPLEDDDEGTMVAEEVPALRDLSAEERAVNPTGTPPYHEKDSYIDEP